VAVAAGAPEERYEFTYDSGWRRIRTRVWRWDEETLGDEADTLGAWVLVRDERTVYDEWNPVAQIDAAGQVVQRHLWGTDLSGTPQGAGGVGGLLGTWDNGATTRDGNGPGDGVARVWVCAYDGNGNVSAAIAATVAGGSAGSGSGGPGTVRVARYGYDAFGKTLATWGDGAVAEANRYRFSTKPEDGTGLLYYGYRYLDTRMGRWVSRDPIGERGGVNILTIAENLPISRFDILGLEIEINFKEGVATISWSYEKEVPTNKIIILERIMKWKVIDCKSNEILHEADETYFIRPNNPGAIKGPIFNPWRTDKFNGKPPSVDGNDAPAIYPPVKPRLPRNSKPDKLSDDQKEAQADYERANQAFMENFSSKCTRGEVSITDQYYFLDNGPEGKFFDYPGGGRSRQPEINSAEYPFGPINNLRRDIDMLVKNPHTKNRPIGLPSPSLSASMNVTWKTDDEPEEADFTKSERGVD